MLCPPQLLLQCHRPITHHSTNPISAPNTQQKTPKTYMGLKARGPVQSRASAWTRPGHGKCTAGFQGSKEREKSTLDGPFTSWPPCSKEREGQSGWTQGLGLVCTQPADYSSVLRRVPENLDQDCASSLGHPLPCTAQPGPSRPSSAQLCSAQCSLTQSSSSGQPVQPSSAQFGQVLSISGQLSSA